MSTKENGEGFTLEGVLKNVRENVEAAAAYAKELAGSAKDTIDRKAAEKKRQQLIAAIMERWVYLNRDTISADREIRDLFVLLDVFDTQIAQLDRGATDDDH